MQFIEEYRGEHGVEPICRVLKEADMRIAPSTFYARKSRPPSVRTLADAQLDMRLEQVHADNFGVYGARKMWRVLNRLTPQAPVARCAVERRMRALGLQGVPNARSTRTTRPAPAQACPLDRLGRDFTAQAPDRRWVADI